jgi:hypothetical protein
LREWKYSFWIFFFQLTIECNERNENIIIFQHREKEWNFEIIHFHQVISIIICKYFNAFLQYYAKSPSNISITFNCAVYKPPKKYSFFKKTNKNSSKMWWEKVKKKLNLNFFSLSFLPNNKTQKCSPKAANYIDGIKFIWLSRDAFCCCVFFLIKYQNVHFLLTLTPYDFFTCSIFSFNFNIFVCHGWNMPVAELVAFQWNLFLLSTYP